VVNVGNDGDIAYRLGHGEAFLSFGSANQAMGIGDARSANRRATRQLLF